MLLVVQANGFRNNNGLSVPLCKIFVMAIKIYCEKCDNKETQTGISKSRPMARLKVQHILYLALIIDLTNITY